MLSLCRAFEIANVKWTATQIVTFLQLLRKYECLWRLTHKDRKNKHYRDAAFENLLAEVQDVVGPPDLDMVTMKSKMKNLKTVYSRELAKVLKSGRRGVTYVPGLRWYSVADSFLRHSKEAKEASLATVDIHDFLKNELHQGSMSDTDCEVVQAIDSSHEYSKDPFTVSFDDGSSGNATPTSESKPKLEKCASNHSSNGVSSSSKNSCSLIALKRKLENESEAESGKSMKTSCDPEDQYCAFGLYVSAELRQITDETQLKLAKHYINSILFDASMSALLPP